MKVFFEQAFKILLQSRPTAINLFWAVDRMRSKMNENINTFDKSKILVDSFGVRGFQEKIYNNKVKSKVYKQ